MMVSDVGPIRVPRADNIGGVVTDVKHMGVIGNLLINYLNFFIKWGSLRNGHNRKGGGGVGGQDQKEGISSGTYLYWKYIGVPPPPPPNV